ncbi:MAG: hypothetical protein QM681_25095 [Novosphingobium sp.]
MDTSRHRPYLTFPMAHRLILTLLALLTGLAAQVSPADACASRVSAVQVLAAHEVAAKAPRAPVALAQLPEPGLRNTRLHAPLQPVAFAPVVVPTVLTGIDRARQ